MEGNVCENFVNYFEINEHDKNTRNKNILLTVPKIKLELARSGFFSMGVISYTTYSTGRSDSPSLVLAIN